MLTNTHLLCPLSRHWCAHCTNKVNPAACWYLLPQIHEVHCYSPGIFCESILPPKGDISHNTSLKEGGLPWWIETTCSYHSFNFMNNRFSFHTLELFLPQIILYWNYFIPVGFMTSAPLYLISSLLNCKYPRIKTVFEIFVNDFYVFRNCWYFFKALGSY